MFGTPKVETRVEGKVLSRLRVIKGAPCGATWLAAQKVEGLPLEEALTRFGLEVQFFCTANPGDWDPIWQKSPVHLAADIHRAVLEKSIKPHCKSRGTE